MILAGLQNLSLVDFPGHLAAAVFLQGCNFRCGYCQNPELVTLEHKFDFTEEKLFEFLSRRKNVLEGVVVTGGEPTIYKELPSLIEKIKETGLKVKIDTNGSNPKMLDYLLRERLVDYIAIDIKTSLAKYDLVTDLEGIQKDLEESLRLAILATVPYEFRTTCVPGIVGAEDFESLGEIIRGAERYCLQQFRGAITYDKKFADTKPYTTQDLEAFKKILLKRVKEVDIRGT